MPTTKSFEDALMERMNNMPHQGPQPCRICESKVRDKIEKAMGMGVPFTVIADTLKDIGLYPKEWSRRHAQELVSRHKKEHMNGSSK